MKGRGHRRAQRERIIARRRARFEAITGRPFWSHVGKLEHRSGLGCPDGRACPVCRLPDERAAERREARATVAEQEPLDTFCWHCGREWSDVEIEARFHMCGP